MYELPQFIKFLRKRKQSGFSSLLTVILLLFLPAQGYYQTVQAIWQKPEIVFSDLILPLPAVYPQRMTDNTPPEITARGAVVLDLPSAVKLFEKNSHFHFLPASTTKMMTALVALEYFPLDEILTVPKLTDEGQDIKLIKGEQMTVENLLYALLVASANDAGETLAASYPGGRAAFVAKMNEKAKSLSLKNTHFVNPNGIDQEGQYTSAFDLALLAKYALENPVFAKIVATSKITMGSVDGKRAHQLENINQLLGKVEGVRGVKTGWTLNAGECLVTYVERNGQKIMIVVLGSQDRFGETRKLINWVFANFEWSSLTL